MKFKFCPECGYKFDREYKFCPECGANLNEIAGGAASATPAQGIKAEPKAEKFVFEFSEDTAGLSESFDKQLKERSKNGFNIVLKAIGDNKVTVIKTVMDFTGLSLADAKRAVESFGIIKRAMPETDAEYFAAKLREAGAQVEVQENSGNDNFLSGVSVAENLNIQSKKKETPENSAGILSKDDAGDLFAKYTKDSLRKAFSSIKYYAESGDAEFQNYYACYYDRAVNDKQDVVKASDETAFYWFKKSAEQGFANSQFFLGVSYYEGIGCTQNKNEGILWLKKAAQQGEDAAKWYLEDLNIKW